MSHGIYRGTKVCLIKSPCPYLHKGPPSGHASLLGILGPLTDRVIFRITSLQQLETYQVPESQSKQGKYNQGHSGQVAVARCAALATGGSGRRA
jgi:hypothetical protein